MPLPFVLILFQCLRQQVPYSRDEARQLIAKSVSSFQIIGAVIAQPYLALGVFPGQRLERQVNRHARRGNHQRSTSLGAAKEE
jgi:hypothetical protein